MTRFTLCDKWVGSGTFRPHILDCEHEGQCWCRPEKVEATCPCHLGQQVWGHSEVELLPDREPRMMAYSRVWPGFTG